jgi:hypothetical protein
VGHQQRGDPGAAAQVQEHLLQVAAGDGVERAKGLVEQHHARFGRQGTRHGHPLTLPAGELVRPAGAERRRRQPHQVERAHGGRLGIGAAHQPRHQRRVAQHRPVRQQAALLRHVADTAAQRDRVERAHVGPRHPRPRRHRARSGD